MKGTRVIFLQELRNKLSYFKQVIEEKLSHPYLLKHVQLPNIDEDKILLFYELFQKADVSKEDVEKYVVTAMLVQIALDTHDSVGVTKCKNRNEFVKRQLTVLAGDYFSGLYYDILAKMNDVEMIQIYALAIRDINEHKIRLYQLNQDIKMIIECFIQVETALYQLIGNHFRIDHMTKLSKLFLTFKRICQEAKNLDMGINSVFINGFEHFSKSEMETIRSNLLSFSQKYMVETIKLLETIEGCSPFVKQFLYDRIHAIKFSQEKVLDKMVEEG